MKIFLIKRETSFGPVFSSQQKAKDYLRREYKDYPEIVINKVVRGSHPYVNIVEVELDDEDFWFDG